MNSKKNSKLSVKLKNSNYIQELFGRYLNEQSSPKERRILLRYFESAANKKELRKLINDELQSMDRNIDRQQEEEANLDSLLMKIISNRSNK